MRAGILWWWWVIVCGAALAGESGGDGRCYELRVYQAAPGKLGELNARFRDHTCRLFDRHGMTCVGFWVPQERHDQRLIFLLAYPNREERERSWKAFTNDPEWQAVRQTSESNGKLVARVESLFLEATDYSPEIRTTSSESPRVFELRTYTTIKGRGEVLNIRFREAAAQLFRRHGMEEIGYWVPTKGQPGAQERLVFLLAHKDRESAEAALHAFEADPQWIALKKASDQRTSGSLMVASGAKSVLLVPTEYSALR